MSENYIELDAVIHHFDFWVEITNPEILKNQMESFLTESGFTIINFVENHFPKEGYTCVWLLAESHLAIHTFPNKNKSYIQLSSCNAEKKDRFETLMNNYFNQF